MNMNSNSMQEIINQLQQIEHYSILKENTIYIYDKEMIKIRHYLLFVINKLMFPFRKNIFF